MTLKNNRAPNLHHFKLCASFQSHRWIQTGVTVRKRPIRTKSVIFLYPVTLKFDGWPWKTIGHLFYTTLSFVHHFKVISEFKLELQFGNAQFGSKSVIFNMTPLLCCFKLCAPFHSHWLIQTGVTVRKHPIWVKIDIFSHVNLKFDGMTLKNNRAPLSNIKLCASFHHHMCIQTGVTARKQLSGVLFSVTDLWPLTLAFCTDITSVNGNNSWKFKDDKMTGTLSKRCDGWTDGQTEAKKWGHPLSWLYIVFLQQSLTSYWEKRKDDSLMLATIRDDTCNSPETNCRFFGPCGLEIWWMP